MLLVVSTFLGCKHEESADKKSRAGNGATNKHDAKLIPGKEFSYDNLVWVGGGTYKMGSNTGQKDEQPVHTVKLNGFWIGKFEVTNAEFSEFTKATGYKTVAEAAPKAEDFPDIPLEQFKEMGLKPGSIVFTPPNVDIAVERLKEHGMFTNGGNMWTAQTGDFRKGQTSRGPRTSRSIRWYTLHGMMLWLTAIGKRKSPGSSIAFPPRRNGNTQRAVD